MSSTDSASLNNVPENGFRVNRVYFMKRVFNPSFRFATPLPFLFPLNAGTPVSSNPNSIPSQYNKILKIQNNIGGKHNYYF